MLKNSSFSVGVTTAYFLIYLTIAQLQLSATATILMFSISPFFIIWMVYTVIRYGKYGGRELREDEEYGYGDKRNEDLGIF